MRIRPSLLSLTTPLLALALTACGGGSDSDDAPTGGGSTNERVASCGTSGGALRVMPMGDSITEAEVGHNSYRRDLWMNLLGAGCQVNFVGSHSGVSGGSAPNGDFDQDNEGHWGWRTDEVSAQTAGWVASAAPDIVLVHLGTNDMFQGESAPNVAQELGALIDNIRAGKPDARILLAKIITNAPDPAGAAALNAQIDGVAASRGVTVVDQAAGFSTADLYDGVHPNPSGEAKLAARWTQAILALRS
jgi:acyl-CoA thioesterase I